MILKFNYAPNNERSFNIAFCDNALTVRIASFVCSTIFRIISSCIFSNCLFTGITKLYANASTIASRNIYFLSNMFVVSSCIVCFYKLLCNILIININKKKKKKLKLKQKFDD